MQPLDYPQRYRIERATRGGWRSFAQAFFRGMGYGLARAIWRAFK